jgi:hypothetical protein
VSPEAGYVELATYYKLPVVSIKACCYHLMRLGLPGFMVGETRRWAGGQGMDGGG